MRKTKKLLAIVLAVVTLVSATALSLAYFTDYELATASATAGTLDIELAETWNNSNPNRENTKPGDIFDLDYTITNKGNKSADVRETFVIRSSVALNTSAPEFQIYFADDVQQIADGTYAPKAGKSAIVAGKLSNSNKTITFSLKEFTIDGTGTAAETGDASASTNGCTVSQNVMTGNYVILFSNAASNSFQGVDVTIDYLAEAKQHRNTGADTWAVVAKESITFAGGSVNAVPEA